MTESKPRVRLQADGSVRYLGDGLVNVAANLGTARDKASYTRYAASNVSFQDLIEMYRTSWLAQAIVDMPALDTVRKWRQWNGDEGTVDAIDGEETRLDLRGKVRQALVAARLFGGSAIYIGTDQNPIEPLNVEAVKRGGLRSLTMMTPIQMTPMQICWDIESPYYGKPDYYTLAGFGSTITVHASRLAVFWGVPQPDPTLITRGWGDSVLLASQEAIKAYDSFAANVNSLAYEAKIDVFRMSGMKDAFLTHPDTADEAMRRRLSAMATIKGINGALVLDGDDEYDQKNASFGGLPELWDRFMLNASGAANIPVTRLFGRTAAGLSGSGDGDERVYYDRRNAAQELEVRPAMAMLDDCLIRSATGGRDPKVFYQWNPMRQLTESEKATIFKTTAEAARTLAGNGAVPPLVPLEALSAALVVELTEQNVLPGIDDRVAELQGLGGGDEGDDEAAMGIEKSADNTERLGASTAEKVNGR